MRTLTAFTLSAVLCAVPAAAQQEKLLPPDATEAADALKRSSRHQEWVDITVPGSTVPLKTFVVYPERKEKAGVASPQ